MDRKVGFMGKGVRIDRLWQPTPSSKAGIQENDVILKVNKKHFPTSAGFLEYIRSTQKIGKPLYLQLYRNGDVIKTAVVPENKFFMNDDLVPEAHRFH